MIEEILYVDAKQSDLLGKILSSCILVRTPIGHRICKTQQSVIWKTNAPDIRNILKRVTCITGEEDTSQRRGLLVFSEAV